MCIIADKPVFMNISLQKCQCTSNVLYQSCYSFHYIVMFWQLPLRDAVYNKCQSKPKMLSRMDNPETLVTLGTQDTRRRQKKPQHNTAKLQRCEKTGPLHCLSFTASIYYFEIFKPFGGLLKHLDDCKLPTK